MLFLLYQWRYGWSERLSSLSWSQLGSGTDRIWTHICLSPKLSSFSTSYSTSTLKTGFSFYIVFTKAEEEKENFLILFFFVFSRATPVAYGGSQARGQTEAVDAGLRQSHSNTKSKPPLRPTPWFTECRILNPLSEARDRTHNLVVPSWIR